MVFCLSHQPLSTKTIMTTLASFCETKFQLCVYVQTKRFNTTIIERLMVRGSQVALKHIIHDLVTRTLVVELRRRAIKRWVPCDDMDCRLKIPHSAKVECGFQKTTEECPYDSGLIGL